MNKAELINEMVGTLLKKKEASIALEILGEIVTRELHAGNEVTLPGIGKLTIVERGERQGRNPQTGEAITIAAKKTIHFSAAKALKDAVNK